MVENAEWASRALADVVTLKRGYDLPASARRPGRFRVVTSGDGDGWHDQGPVSGPGVTIGRATNIGRPKWVASAYWPHNTTLFVADFHGNEPRWVYHLFENLDLSGFDSGSVQPMLNRNYISQLRVHVPPRAEQQAIAEVLGALDDKIAANTRLAAAAESLAVALVSALPLTSTLGALVTHHRTMVAPDSLSDPVVEHFSLPSFDSGKHPELAAPSSIKSGKFAIEQRSVLISKLNPRIPRIWLTPASTGIRQLASTEFLVLAPRALDPAVLWALAMQPSFSAALEGKVAGTSGSHQRVKPGDMLDTPIGDPAVIPEEDKAAIVALCASTQSARTENINLAATRDALLPALMSGRLRVKDAEKVVSDAV